VSGRAIGKRIWVFPDGDLPPLQPYDPNFRNEQTHGHESLVVLNAGPRHATLRMTVYFSDKPPLVVEPLEVSAERVVCFRTDEPIGPFRIRIPEGQYALVLESNEPIVAQIGRMDIRQPNLAYYTVMGFAAE
jgi:hypothetical protein